MDFTIEELREEAIYGKLCECAIETTGIYPQSSKGGKNPYEKRTEAMEAHNKCVMSITNKICLIEKFISNNEYK